MDLVYTSFKTRHVIAAIVWLGGLVGAAVLNAQIAAAGVRPAAAGGCPGPGSRPRRG